MNGPLQLVTLTALQSGTIAGKPNKISLVRVSVGLFLLRFVNVRTFSSQFRTEVSESEKPHGQSG